ncbi:DUF1839 family protein [Gordonia sp. TBRC 11910]|uniref:DUF1839 family protein n=1 Tax=Gordonia asplenii TaxID=2725283 RepID=A0A848L2W3_9ACTN|nr:DUF1839 family protein [Gordonia asplenii]NMO02891.1 DUF1839 family protein [Gordonia asplenii]
MSTDSAARPGVALSVDVTAAEYLSHRTHSPERIWQETNCYLDLWIELLHGLGHDPVPAFACALSADHDGAQWTFVKPAPEDLRRLYGLEVTEETLWRPVLDTVLSGPSRGLLHTVEVDSWWLPDTAGTDYRTNHVKTTIVPIAVDADSATMTYVHNAGVFELSGDDFAGIFAVPELPPYVEQVRRLGDDPGATISSAAVVAAARAHLDRRAPGNPAVRLADSVRGAVGWLADAGMETFHLWSFATLRQFGATAEIAADLADRLAADGYATADAAAEFRVAASTAKTVQFKMARAARGRNVDVDDLLGTLTESWQRGIDGVDHAVPQR